jgi:hypothetical protein
MNQRQPRWKRLDLYVVYHYSVQRHSCGVTGKRGPQRKDSIMRKPLPIALLAVAVAILATSAKRPVSAASAPTAARFAADGKLERPVDYRRWVYLSSGFGMSYSQQASGMQAFTNVFVNPTSYDYYLANGTWPDKTIFVLEEYGSTSQGSINKHGSYQTGFMGLDVEVKDEARFPDKWAYFNFSGEEKSVGAISPAKNACWKCHDQSAAVEHSFVQFYPELLKVAQTKGTIKPGVKLGSE